MIALVVRLDFVNELEHEAGLPPTPGYRYADLVGTRLYVAGQVPSTMDADVATQARECLANLFAVIGAHDFSRDDIHQLTIYVVGEPADLRAAWAAVTDVCNNNVPPATLLGVAALGYDNQRVEIDAQLERT